MRQRRIKDATVSAIGLGAMPLSISGRPDRDVAIGTIRAALDAGITLIDTADVYASDAAGHNEELIAEALAGRREEVLVATKGGLVHRAGGTPRHNGTPEHLTAAARASAKRLGLDAIGLYQLHRPDPAVPWEESVGALRELLDDGVIRLAGIANATVEQIRSADRVLGGRLASVQNEFSPAHRPSESELDYCAEHEIAFLARSPLGGAYQAGGIAVAAEVAAELRVSPQRVILAWELTLQHTLIAIPGARRPASIRDAARAADLVLTADQIARLSV